MHSEVSAALKITTVEELATYKFYLIAKSLKTLAGVETKDGRLSGSVMNVDEAVDKDAEAMTFTEMIESPIHILQGLTPEAEALFAKMDVKSVGDLADWKYAHWAEAMVELSKFEFTKTGTSESSGVLVLSSVLCIFILINHFFLYGTETERKVEREMKALA